MNRRQKGFTLVELAIVLTIVGLLVGAILAGQNLIKNQQARRVLRDALLYATSIQQFSDKYGALPGDMPDAVRVWGRADGNTDTTGNCADPVNNASNGITTCNGNGDGIINVYSTSTEGFWAWQQLKAAGYIIGNFTGIHGPSTNNNAVPGVNSPVGPISGSTYWLYNWGLYTSGGFLFDGDYSGVMAFGKAGSDWPQTPALTSGDAWAMDKKADDGRPGTGDIRSLNNTWQNTCATSNAADTAVYNLSTSATEGCTILFMQTFYIKPKV